MTSLICSSKLGKLHQEVFRKYFRGRQSSWPGDETAHGNGNRKRKTWTSATIQLVTRGRRLLISYNDCISKQTGKGKLQLHHDIHRANHTASVSQKFTTGPRTGVVGFFGPTLCFLVLQRSRWEQGFEDSISTQPWLAQNRSRMWPGFGPGGGLVWAQGLARLRHLSVGSGFCG